MQHPKPLITLNTIFYNIAFPMVCTFRKRYSVLMGADNLRERRFLSKLIMLQKITTKDGLKALSIILPFYHEPEELIPLQRALYAAINCLAQNDFTSHIEPICLFLEDLLEEDKE